MTNSDDDILVDNDDDDEEELADDMDSNRPPPPQQTQYSQCNNNNLNLNSTMRPRGRDIGQQQPRHLFQDPWQGMSQRPLVPHGHGNYPPLHGYGPLPSQLVAEWMPNNNNNNNVNVNINTQQQKKRKKNTDETCTSSKFNDTEKDTLVEIIGEILPIGNPCWVRVESAYNATFPMRRRHLENLRKQFNGFVAKKMPTGDPNCPTCVRDAKRIKDSIYQKSLSLTMGGDDDEDPEDIVGPPGNQLALHNQDDDSGSGNGNNANGNTGYETTTSNLTGTSQAPAAVSTPGSSLVPPKTPRGGRDGAIGALVSAYLAAETTKAAQAKVERKEERRRERRREKREDRKFQLMLAAIMSDGKGKKKKKNVINAVAVGVGGSSSSGSESDDEDSDEHCGSDASTYSKKQKKRK